VALAGSRVVAPEVDTGAERCLLVLFRSSLQFVSGRELETLSAVNLHRVVTIAGEDDKTMRTVSVIRHSVPPGRSFSALVRTQVPAMEGV